MKIKTSTVSADEHLEIKFLQYEHHTIDELDLSVLSEVEVGVLQSFKADKRKLEYYFTRYLWRNFMNNYSKEHIQYEASGKPFISKGNISISHSKDTIAIGYSKDHIIGIDIEHYNEKIKRIATKFLSVKERTKFDCNDLTTITTMWSVKEAVYKLGFERGMSFSQQIQLQEVGDVNRVLVSTKNFTGLLKFERLLFDEFVLTFCDTQKIEESNHL